MRMDIELKYGNINVFLKSKVIQIKFPWDLPLFTERYGWKKPVFRFGGFRVFIIQLV